jgi:four helix bundle protein
MTIYQEKQEKFEQITVNFSVQTVKTLGKYSKNITLRPLVGQVIRSSSSIGANYAEANNASSKLDFKNKIYIAKQEAAETKYWLRVLSELIPDEDLTSLQQESLELVLILQKIISSLNAK